MKMRYALVGAGNRVYHMYTEPMIEKFSKYMEIVGVFDLNPLRCEVIKNVAGLTCKSYTDFDRLIEEQRPDRCIITTIDRTHHEYIIKCLEAGIDVIVDKPMTIDAEKCRAVLDAEKRTGRKIIVGFNLRYAPYMVEIKRAIMNGIVGEILSVDLEWLLGTVHGADYFRRWHRRKENSGGLLVHKSTHHFDLVNWWTNEEPVEVIAYGNRRCYGPVREARGERCLTCKHKRTCKFYFDIEKMDYDRILYRECESADGYYRDRCVFDEEIDIEDTMSVNVRYSGGTVLSYSLIAHSPYEGWKAAINGSTGRIEIGEFYSGLLKDDPCCYIDHYDRNGNKTRHTIPKATGDHGGGDERMLEMVFDDSIPDPLGQQASSYIGALSILIGIAANKSIAEGRNIKLNDLVPLTDYRPQH